MLANAPKRCRTIPNWLTHVIYVNYHAKWITHWTHPKCIASTPKTCPSDFKHWTNDQIYSFEMTKSFRFGSLQDQHGHILFTAIKRFQHWTRGTSTFFKYVFTSHLHGLIFRNNETIATQNIHRRHSHVSIITTSSTLQLNWNIVTHFSFDTFLFLTFFVSLPPYIRHQFFSNPRTVFVTHPIPESVSFQYFSDFPVFISV